MTHSDPTPIRKILDLLLAGGPIDADQMRAGFDCLLSGEVPAELIAGFLVALRMKGETKGDLVAGASAMRALARQVAAPADAVDTCGTGGLPRTTLNTSTASAFVVAGAGGCVAKHGNRSVPPKTGSADVLEALGVKLDISDEVHQRALDQAGVSFLFAPGHHGAMRHVAPVRKALGIRTIFNLLGPLTNPAGVRFQVLGVFATRWAEPVAQALAELGTQHALVVCGREGLDELSVCAETDVVEVVAGDLKRFVLAPEDVGLSRWPVEDLNGGPPRANADRIVTLLDGKKDAFRDAVCFNAGGALYVSGKSESIRAGVDQAQHSIDSGKAASALEKLIEITNDG